MVLTEKVCAYPCLALLCCRVALESALTVVQLDLRPMPGQSLPPSAPPPPMPSTSSLSLSSSPLRTATTPSTGTTPGDAAAIAAAQGLHALRFKLCFAPMKALATTAQLAVKRSSGARWVFDVHLTVSHHATWLHLRLDLCKMQSVVMMQPYKL